MDAAHLHKIEQGVRIPTEEQTSNLARFYGVNETKTQARRIAERFRREFAGHPAVNEAICILATEARIPEVGAQDQRHKARFL